MAEISLQHITKEYQGNVTAVKDLNLEVHDQEFIILVGPSGCGKSTTLRMIAGLEDITSGTLSIDGKPMNNVEPNKRDIAMVFQNYALYPHMNVYDNIAFPLKIKRFSAEEVDMRVHQVAEILDLEGLLNRKPKALSGGQRQRVAMGRAIIRNPKVFLMDEPLSNLDAKLRVQMRIEIARLHRKLGATIIYVTHDQTEAMTLGTRIVVMNEGVVQQIDTPQNLYRHPSNKFVASFIGAPQMNFLDGMVSDDCSEIHFSDDAYLTVSSSHKKSLRAGNYSGKAVTVGVRPEATHLAFNEEPVSKEPLEEFKTPLLSSRVKFHEMLGSESFTYFDQSGVQLVAKTSPDIEFFNDMPVSFKFDPDAVHIFDKETELSIM